MKQLGLSLLTALESDSVRYFALIKVDLLGGLYLTDLSYPVVFEGNTYVPDGGLQGYEPPRNSSTVDRELYKIHLIDNSNYLAAAFRAGAVGADIEVRLCVYDESGHTFSVENAATNMFEENQVFTTNTLSNMTVVPNTFENFPTPYAMEGFLMEDRGDGLYYNSSLRNNNWMLSFEPGEEYIVSCYVKRLSGYDNPSGYSLGMGLDLVGKSGYTYFNMRDYSLRTLGSSHDSASIEPIGTRGVHRLWYKFTNASDVDGRFYFSFTDLAGPYLNDGTAKYLVSDVQVEKIGYPGQTRPTSPIATYTTEVTRPAGVARQHTIGAYTGYIDATSVTNDFNKKVATIEAASPMADLDAVNPFLTSRDGMDQKSATDTSFDSVYENSETVELKWGKV